MSFRKNDFHEIVEDKIYDRITTYLTKRISSQRKFLPKCFYSYEWKDKALLILWE